MKKSILSTLAILIFGAAQFFATIPAYAAGTSNQSNFLQGLVQFIANEFHLDQGQVQTVVNTYKTQHMQTMQHNMQNKEKQHLDSLVSSGKITAAQEQQILDEQAKLQSEYNPANFKNLTPDNKKAQFQKEQDEIKAWSRSTGIDAKYLMPGFGRMRMFNHWNNNAHPTSGQVSATPTSGV